MRRDLVKGWAGSRKQKVKEEPGSQSQVWEHREAAGKAMWRTKNQPKAKVIEMETWALRPPISQKISFICLL